ncbi:hypothetical protein IEE87_27110 (plasmid) [Klebsiella pneumoniae]|nr:hypothetical protein IEE87_27110 [Klebsiella pneumoniae]
MQSTTQFKDRIETKYLYRCCCNYTKAIAKNAMLSKMNIKYPFQISKLIEMGFSIKFLEEENFCHRTKTYFTDLKTMPHSGFHSDILLK